LTGDFFGGDRIDYLLRDSYFTGLAYGSFDYLQLIDNLRLLFFKNKVVLGLEENGLESCYALLLARYFMHKRLYQYPNVKAYSFHMKEILKQYFYDKDFLQSVEQYIKVNDYHILAEITNALFDKTHMFHEHAKSVMQQEKRVSVYPITKKEFDSLMRKFPDLSQKIIFEKNAYATSFGLFFPVLLKNAIIKEAQEIADIHIPASKKDWAYIVPGISINVEKALSDVTSSLYKTTE